MPRWRPTDKDLHEMIENEVLWWVVQDRLDEPSEPWDEMNDDDDS